MLQRHNLEATEIKLGVRIGIVFGKTFNDICDYWLKHKAPKKKTEKDDISITNHHLRPAFGHFLLKDIDTRAVDAFICSIDHLSKKTQKNILVLFKTILKRAVKLHWLERLPHIDMPKVPKYSRNFDYLKTVDEIRRFLEAAEPEGKHIYILYATAVFTGMRAGELAGLLWDSVDLDNGLITVQRSYKNPYTKNMEIRYVPILDVLYEELRWWALNRPHSRIVFPNQRNNIQCQKPRVFNEIFHRVLERAELPQVLRNGKMRPYIRFHDLRHTFASHWMMKRGDIFKLQKILGHKSIEMTMRYAHLDPDAFEADRDRFGGRGALKSGEIITFPAISNGDSPKRRKK